MLDIKGIKYAANTVRLLAIDAIQKANSGHPGLPMGCAELGVLLYSEVLKHDPSHPGWVDRDRFVLSAGHGSMLLYSLLHLAGYGISLEDITAFRTVGSVTPGHPELSPGHGIETTTGPLGQGLANAVGMAIAEEMLAARLNDSVLKIVDHYTYVLCSDGDLMEGVSAEAASIAGHLGLGKLIVIYDNNSATIDGTTDLCFSENVSARFASYGWQVLAGNAYDLESIQQRLTEARDTPHQPTFINVRSIIGKGAPTQEGSYKTHGGALGDDEVRAFKRALGLPETETFHVYPEGVEYFRSKASKWQASHDDWASRIEKWRNQWPDRYREWSHLFEGSIRRANCESDLPEFQTGEKIATRVANGLTLDAITKSWSEVVGGSGDLTVPVFGKYPDMDVFSASNRAGRFIHYGVREHAMAGISNGIALHGGLRPFCGTFLAFSDYMRPSIRLAALMSIPVIYAFSHDSVWIGEDGPTHQPVEHVATLEAIPNLLVLRPGDAEETVEAWKAAMDRHAGPTAIILSRQELPVYPKRDEQWRTSIQKGAYVVHDPPDKAEIVLVASGSEVSTSLEIAGRLPGRAIRVVSMISKDLFLRQSPEDRRRILPRSARIIVINAGIAQGWEAIYLDRAPIVSVERFGVSGPGGDVAEALQIGPEAALLRVKSLLDDAETGD